jgi:hypothetical protein
MNRLLLTLIVAAFGATLFSSPAYPQKSPYAKGQVPPLAPPAVRVLITRGPELESAKDGLAIVRWYGSQGPEPDGKISHQVKPRSSGNHFPRTRA